jgi:MFS family permease
MPPSDLIAPIAVFAARLLQGFAVAGEFGSSTAFMIEHSAHRKAFFASWQFAGQQAAKLLAALFGLGSSPPSVRISCTPGAGASRSSSACWWDRSACISGARWMRHRSFCRPVHTPAPRSARSLPPRRHRWHWAPDWLPSVLQHLFRHLHAHLRHHPFALAACPPDTSRPSFLQLLMPLCCIRWPGTSRTGSATRA